MTEHATSDGHLTWPADRFYWAVLDASMLPRGLARSQHDQQRLGYLFEAELPVPIEQVQAVYLPLGDDHYLACGLEHEQLEQLTSSALTLQPDRVPLALPAENEVAVATINLLVERHEPGAVRRERHRFVRESVALAGLLMLAIGLGVSRRSRAWDAAVADLAAERADLYQSLYDPASMPPSAQPASLRLIAELRQLRRTRSETAHANYAEPESAQSLQALLTNWPDEQPMRTESISITPTSMTVTGVLPSAGQAQAFVAAFVPPEGWESRQPQVSTMSDGVRLTWRLARRPDHKQDAGSAAPLVEAQP